MRKPTIAVDFDGVIHKYSKGWQDGTIYDGPMDGALDALRYMLEKKDWNVFVFTSRDPVPVVGWLASQFNRRYWSDVFFRVVHDDEKFWQPPERQFVIGTIGVTNRKLPADCYLDDRGLTFIDWQQALPLLEATVAHDGKYLVKAMHQTLLTLSQTVHALMR